MYSIEVVTPRSGWLTEYLWLELPPELEGVVVRGVTHMFGHWWADCGHVWIRCTSPAPPAASP